MSIVTDLARRRKGRETDLTEPCESLYESLSRRCATLEGQAGQRSGFDL